MIVKILFGAIGMFYFLLGILAKMLHWDTKALLFFQKAYRRLPNNGSLTYFLANIETDKQHWKKALPYWRKAYKKRKGMFSAYDYEKFSNVLYKTKQQKELLTVLENGYATFPSNKKIIVKLIDITKKRQLWEKSAYYWQQYLKLGDINLQDYLELLEVYKHAKWYQHAEEVLHILRDMGHPASAVQEEKIKISILSCQWQMAISLLEELLADEEPTSERVITLSMLYQIIGEHPKARELFKVGLHIVEENDEQTDGPFKKLVIFDNGESRIEFYKKLAVTDTVMVTFDSINMEWDRPSFAFRLLKNLNQDIIAIRKRKKQTYQQDLSLEDFLQAVTKLVNGYQVKLAYGFSLGAYSALYFATHLDCRILAIAPRLSIHPIYGRTKIIPKFEMKHNKTFTYNDRISPIIVFDPKNALDNRYIHEQILISFPKAQLVKIPYGGHSIAPHLLKMGLLKEFVCDFIEGKTPTYDRTKKHQSFHYFWNLGKECLKRNKLTWAYDLAQKAVALEPTEKTAIKFMMDVYKRLHQYEEAIDFLKQSIEQVPKNLTIRLYLIDLYISRNRHNEAKRLIDASYQVFGKRKVLVQREEKIIA